jgi:hypothetical protein
MSKQKEKKQARKKAQKIVFNKLSVALAEFRGTVKEKKLENNLRKFSRSLAEDIVKAEKKKNKTQTPKIKVAGKKELVLNQDHQQAAM